MGSGDAGFIYVSMGSSVKAANMPEHLRHLLVQTFAQLPYRVLWKWEAGNNGMHDLPPNVKLSRWLPQQDILGNCIKGDQNHLHSILIICVLIFLKDIES